MTPKERKRERNRRYYQSHVEYFAAKARDRKRRLKQWQEHDRKLALRDMPIVMMTPEQFAAL